MYSLKKIIPMLLICLTLTHIQASDQPITAPQFALSKKNRQMLRHIKRCCQRFRTSRRFSYKQRVSQQIKFSKCVCRSCQRFRTSRRFSYKQRVSQQIKFSKCVCRSRTIMQRFLNNKRCYYTFSYRKYIRSLCGKRVRLYRNL